MSVRSLKNCFFAGLIALFAQLAPAAIDPVLIRLTYGNQSYTVPTNRILVVEHGYFGEQAAAQFVVISNGASVAGFRVDISWFKQLANVQPTLKIPAGSVVSAPGILTNEDQNVTMMGLLVSPSDLYAAIPSEFQNVARAGADAQSGLALQSPRPARIKIESSEDLIGWQDRMDALISGGTNRSLYTITIPPDNPLHDFFRADVRCAKPNSGL